MNSKPDGNLISILFVDDDPVIRSLWKTHLERRPGLIVMTASGASEAFAFMDSLDFDVIISDYLMPGTDGIRLLRILRQKGCTVPYILFTGMGSEETASEALNNGATYYIRKGQSPANQVAELEDRIREACRRHLAEQENRETRHRFRTLFEHSGTGVLILDDRLVVSGANAEFTRITGFLPEQIVGMMNLAGIIDSRDREALTGSILLMRRGAIPPARRMSLVLTTADGKKRRVSASIALIPATGGCVISFIETAVTFPTGGTIGGMNDRIPGIPNAA